MTAAAAATAAAAPASATLAGAAHLAPSPHAAAHAPRMCASALWARCVLQVPVHTTWFAAELLGQVMHACTGSAVDSSSSVTATCSASCTAHALAARRRRVLHAIRSTQACSTTGGSGCRARRALHQASVASENAAIGRAMASMMTVCRARKPCNPTRAALAAARVRWRQVSLTAGSALRAAAAAWWAGRAAKKPCSNASCCKTRSRRRMWRQLAASRCDE